MTAPPPRRLVFLAQIVSVLFLSLVIVFSLYGLWKPVSAEQNYPWGSDTLGHLLKAEILQQEIQQGNWYPVNFPYWYNGMQPFRYHPPLPYYLLVGINLFTGDMLDAGHWFVILTALITGLSFLLFARWTGWLPAVIGGLAVALSPEYLRVVLAEGNLPRALASAFLPALTYCVIRLMTGQGNRWHGMATALLVAAAILSHAMMGAIFGLCLTGVVIIHAFLGKPPLRHTLLALSSMAIGLALSAFWFLPSLKGGISDINPQAMTEALLTFSLGTYLDPLLRFGQREIIYLGLSLVLVLFAGLFHPSSRRPIPMTFLIVGALSVLVSTPGFNDLFKGLPAHELFWPIRFLGFSVLALAIPLTFLLKGLIEHPVRKFLLFPIVILLTADFFPSSQLLAFRRPVSQDIDQVAEILASNGHGWREATLDFSRLGSTPSYFFSADTSQEQVFGWAYQGSCTARTVSALNEAIQGGNVSVALDMLDILGADDLVVLKSDLGLDHLAAILPDSGFQQTWESSSLALYQRAGGPRALVIQPQVLGIGPGAYNFAILLPALLPGDSQYVDDYDLAFLSKYPYLVLSSFDWHERRAAESLLLAYLEQGGQVVVDLTGAPDDPLAREPRLFDVYGEHVQFYSEPVQIITQDDPDTLLPFQIQPWQAVVPQGDLVDVVQFSYHDVTGTALGYQEVGEGRIWFVGLNIPYHTLLTGDPLGISIIERPFSLETHATSITGTIPLENYLPDEQGYTFDYTLQAQEELLIPIAACDGTTVEVDGAPATVHPLYNLISITAPAGTHHIEISFSPTGVFWLGAVLSLTGLIFGIVGLFYWKGKRS